MLLTHSGLVGNAPGMRRRRDVLHRRQPLGHNLLVGLVDDWPLHTRQGIHSALDLTDNGGVTSGEPLIPGSLSSQFTSATPTYLSRSSEAALQVADIDFAFYSVIYLDTMPTDPRIISKRLNGTNSHEYDFYVQSSTGQLTFRLRTSAGVEFGVAQTGVGTITTGTIYHVWSWHDSVNDLTGVQINDAAAVTVTTAGLVPTTASSTFMIGQLEQVSRPFNGRIGPVRMWKNYIPNSDERAWMRNGGIGRRYPYVT